MNNTRGRERYYSPGHFPNKTYSINVALSQTQDTPRTNTNSSISNRVNRLETFVERSCSDDLRVVLARGVEVMVVSCDACFFETLGLLGTQHTNSRPSFHAHSHTTTNGIR